MPPKTIYKPSKGVKEASVGKRDKSQRTRIKKEIYQAALPSKKLLKRYRCFQDLYGYCKIHGVGVYATGYGGS